MFSVEKRPKNTQKRKAFFLNSMADAGACVYGDVWLLGSMPIDLLIFLERWEWRWVWGK